MSSGSNAIVQIQCSNRWPWLNFMGHKQTQSHKPGKGTGMNGDILYRKGRDIREYVGKRVIRIYVCDICAYIYIWYSEFIITLNR